MAVYACLLSLYVVSNLFFTRIYAKKLCMFIWILGLHEMLITIFNKS